MGKLMAVTRLAPRIARSEEGLRIADGFVPCVTYEPARFRGVLIERGRKS